MKNLLASDFARLINSLIFRGTLVFCVEFTICEIIVIHYVEQSTRMDYFLNVEFIMFGFITAVFVGLFIGTEFNDGTIRNKLTAGHSRAAIYISDLTICIIAAFIIQVVYLVTLLIASNLMVKTAFEGTKYDYAIFQTSTVDIIKMQLIGFYIIAAYTSVFMLFSMIICSKASATVVSMAVAIVLFASGMSIVKTVSPQTDLTFSFDETEITSQEMEDSQRGEDLTGKKREVFLFLDDFLPSCQAQHLNQAMVPTRASNYILYDFGTIVTTTVFGMIVFRKRDLK